MALSFRVCTRAKSLRSCPALCNPMDCSPPGSSVQGIFQARILECVAISSFEGCSGNIAMLLSPKLVESAEAESCVGRKRGRQQIIDYKLFMDFPLGGG